MVSEDAITREHPARREHKSTIENADRKVRRRNAVVVQKLVESLRLPGVVAKNYGWDSVGDDLFEPLDVALDLLGLAERKGQRGVVAGEIDRAVGAQRPQCLLRRFEQFVAAGRVLAASTGEIDMMLCLGPSPFQLGRRVGAAWDHQQRVRWKERANRGAGRLDVAGDYLPIDRKNERELRVTGRPLGEQIEVSQLRNVVAPKLEAHWLRHPEAVDVEDPAADAELRDIFDHRDSLEPNRFKVRRELLWPTRVAFAELEPGRRERPGQLRTFEKRAARRHHNAQIAATNSLQRFDALAGDLRVRLGLAEALAGRVERDLIGLDQRAQISQPPLGAGNVITDDDEKPLCDSPGEGSDYHGVA